MLVAHEMPARPLLQFHGMKLEVHEANTPHIAIRDPKTGMSRQEWFGPFFLFLIPLVLLLQPHHFVPYGAHGCRVTRAPACIPTHSTSVFL